MNLDPRVFPTILMVLKTMTGAFKNWSSCKDYRAWNAWNA